MSQIKLNFSVSVQWYSCPHCCTIHWKILKKILGFYSLETINTVPFISPLQLRKPNMWRGHCYTCSRQGGLPSLRANIERLRVPSYSCILEKWLQSSFKFGVVFFPLRFELMSSQSYRKYEERIPFMHR